MTHNNIGASLAPRHTPTELK